VKYYLGIFFNSIDNQISRCRARLRARINNDNYRISKNYDDVNQQVEVVDGRHNHEIIDDRRKKGTLKAQLVHQTEDINSSDEDDNDKSYNKFELK
jgi:hypothetical protein